MLRKQEVKRSISSQLRQGFHGQRNQALRTHISQIWTLEYKINSITSRRRRQGYRKKIMPNREKDTRNVSYNSSGSRTSSPLEYNGIVRIPPRMSYPAPPLPPPIVNGSQWSHMMPRDLSAVTTTNSLPAPAFSASAVLTDIGICVRMQNVHLTNIHPPRPSAIMPSPILLSPSSNKQFSNNQMSPPNIILNGTTNDPMIINNNQNLGCDMIPSCCNFSKFQKVNDIITKGEKFVANDFSTKPKQQQKNNNCVNVTTNKRAGSSEREQSVRNAGAKVSLQEFVLQQSNSRNKNVFPVTRNHHLDSNCNRQESSSLIKPDSYFSIQQQHSQKHEQLQQNHDPHQQRQPQQSHQRREQQLENGARVQKSFKDIAKEQQQRRENLDTIATPPPKKKWIRHYLMEEPCKNGDNAMLSASSYLLISAATTGTASNEDISVSTTTNSQVSDQASNSTASCETFLHNCNKINNNINDIHNNKVEINNKRMQSDQILLPSLQPTSSSSLNVGHPPISNKSLATTLPSRSPIPYAPPSKIKKLTPLTPPPTSSRKFVETTRTRSSSLSSTNFTANVGSNASISLASSSLSTAGGVSSSGTPVQTPIGAGGLSAVVAAAAAASATEGTSLLHGSSRIVTNGGGGANGNVLANSGTEDSSQSSLNLSSSGYLSGSSANSSVGVSSSLSNLNISNSSTSSLTSAAVGGSLGTLNGYGPNEHQFAGQTTTTTGRRRTTSTASSGGKQRSPCILRAGTREVHNKLEKHRRAHLKECFEQLKVQLQLRDEEKKKTSNLAILAAAHRHVMSLKRKERELEQQVEQLAKEKINFQKRIVSLKRELAAKHDNFDFSSVLSDSTDIGMIQERDTLSDTLSSGRGSARYSSSSSLSSATTVPSPSGSGSGCMAQATLSSRGVSPPTALLSASSLLSSSLHTTPPSPSNHLHHMHHQPFSKSISPVTTIVNSVPLPLTTKQMSHGSPTPSTPSPSSSSMNGIPPSSPLVSSSGSPSSASLSSLSASPPLSVSRSPLGMCTLPISANTPPTPVPISLKIPNVPNGVKVPPLGSTISSSSQYNPPSSSPLHSASPSLSIISSIPQSNNSLGVSSLASSIVSSTTALSSPSILNYTTSENSILPPTSIIATTTLNTTPMPLNLNTSTAAIVTSTSQPHGQILHSAKDLSGKNGICRKPSGLHEQQSMISATLVTPQQSQLAQQQSNAIAATVAASPAEIILTNSAAAFATTKDKTSEDQKIFNIYNTGVVLSQISMIGQPQSFKMMGTTGGGVATIELSSPQVQARPHSGSPTTQATRTTGPQLHKLLTVSPSSASGLPNGVVTPVVSSLAAADSSRLANKLILSAVKSDVNRVTGPNGHALQIVPTGTTIAPLVVSSSGQAGRNITHLVAAAPSSKVNLPIISTQYLSSIKPMVVAVPSNQAPTLSVPAPAPPVAVATATANGSVS